MSQWKCDTPVSMCHSQHYITWVSTLISPSPCTSNEFPVQLITIISDSPSPALSVCSSLAWQVLKINVSSTLTLFPLLTVTLFPWKLSLIMFSSLSCFSVFLSFCLSFTCVFFFLGLYSDFHYSDDLPNKTKVSICLSLCSTFCLSVCHFSLLSASVLPPLFSVCLSVGKWL